MTSIMIDRNDGLSSSSAIKAACRVVAVSAITLAGLQTIDGVSLAAGDRVLYAVAGANAGIWIVDTGSWRRAKDFAGNRDVRLGTQIYVTSGTTYSASGWYVNTANPIVIGTTAITISQNVMLNAAQLIALEASATAAAADAVAAEVAAEAALAAMQALLPTVTSYIIAHYNAASGVSVPAAIQNITLGGRRSFGDKAGFIPAVRVAVQPTTHNGWVRTADRYLPNGSIDNTNGGYWEFAVGDFANVVAFSSLGNGTNDDWAGIQGAIDYINAKFGIGGTVYVPAPATNYVSLSTIDISVQSLTFRAENQSVIIHGGGLDQKLLTVSAREVLVKDISFYGKGITGLATADTAIGATAACVHFTSSAVNSVLDHCIVYGGYNPVLWEGGDCKMYDCEVSRGYGDALVKIKGGSGWLRRNALDQSWPVSKPGSQTQISPTPAWIAAHAYTVGEIATIGDYIVQCHTAGTSHATTAPTLKNYNVAIPDGAGALSWRLLSPTNFNALRCSDGATEVYCQQQDMTGPFSFAIQLVTSTGLYFKITDGICGQNRDGGIQVATAFDASFTGLTIGSATSIDGPGVVFTTAFAGNARVTNNLISGARGIYWLGAAGATIVATGNTVDCALGGGTLARAFEAFTNTTFFNFSGNIIGAGCTSGMVVLPGTSDHYQIIGNTNAAGLANLVSDGGTGINKHIAGNL